MTNSSIADNFSLLSKLMDINRENSFKAKSYAIASYTIEKLLIELSTLPTNEIFQLKGIGESVAQKILEQLQTGNLKILEDYLAKTPPGVIEMLKIKGIGPKKIATIWHEMQIETIGELLYACNENRLTLYNGFGEKTQQSIKESIEFYVGTLGSYLYQQIEKYADAMHEKLASFFSDELLQLTAAFRRQMEIIEKLEWVTTTSNEALVQFFLSHEYVIHKQQNGYVSFVGNENVVLGFYIVEENLFYNQLFVTSCSETFLQAWNTITQWDSAYPYTNEIEIFESADCNFIVPAAREDEAIITEAMLKKLPTFIEVEDIHAIIHCHSNWSDGMNTIEQLANTCINKGYEYLVLSDHSKTATYAQGLPLEKVMAQHQQIEALNKQLFPFKIFKSIESDILGDGSLDYDNELLSKFDVIIASVHSNLKMTEEKAMTRLLNAIENPFTNILGHMTGRLLLSRNGYPLNHQKIIDACAANNVVIELNAHPRRLDIDWRWIKYALDKNVLISINPDAHSIEGFDDCKYGVLVAQKSGLTKQQNLSSFSLQEFEKFLVEQHQKRNEFF